MSQAENPTYEQYREILAGERLPAAFVNMDALDENIRRTLDIISGCGKTLRVASKSLRCSGLIKYVMEKGGPQFKGLMCYTVEEAAFLMQEGFDDLLISYPTVRASDMGLMAKMTLEGAHVYLIADCEEHILALADAGRKAGAKISAALEVDMSYRPAGNALHIGVRRSPLRSAKRVEELISLAEKNGVRVAGIMGYEAQIAGLADNTPFSRALNPAKGLIKKLSRPYVAEKRHDISEHLEKLGVKIEFFNGGGTGSLHSTRVDKSVTELTAGSGFLCPRLFSYYRNLDLLPAAFFALQAVRVPAPGMVACHGGGYVASGEAGPDKLPLPFLPEGCKLIHMEGAGEVQTPVVLPKGANISIGDPVIFRHAKAGELAERFNEYLLIRNISAAGRMATYRGTGKCFL